MSGLELMKIHEDIRKNLGSPIFSLDVHLSNRTCFERVTIHNMGDGLVRLDRDDHTPVYVTLGDMIAIQLSN